MTRTRVCAPTKGDGNCAFHAIFGEWNADTRRFEALDADKIRNDVARAIQAPRYFSLIKEPIIELMMSGRDFKYDAMSVLKNQYEEYVLRDKIITHNKWHDLNEALKQNRGVLTYINFFIQNYDCGKKQLSFHDQFQICDNESKDALEKLIRPNPLLYKLYSDYKKANPEFDWDKFLSNKAIIAQYACFFARPGQWLLASEIKLIAHVCNISIDFYSGAASKVSHFNPAAKHNVAIYFDGINHYEKMVDPLFFCKKESILRENSMFKHRHSKTEYDIMTIPVQRKINSSGCC